MTETKTDKADEKAAPDDETSDQGSARRFAEATADAKDRADKQAKADEKKVVPEGEPEAPARLEDSPDYRYANEAMPAPSDPSHPAHDVWAHEYANAPTPEVVEEIHAEQAKAEQAEAKAVAAQAKADEKEAKAEAKAE